MPAQPLSPEQLEDAHRLKEAFKRWQSARKSAGLPSSQEAAAGELGDMGQSALNQYLNGKIPLNAPALAKFSKLLGCAPESVSPSIAADEKVKASVFVSFNSADVAPPPVPGDAMRLRNLRRVYVVGQAQGGMPERIWTNGDCPEGATDEFAEVATADPLAFVTRVVSTSMTPRFRPGEFALVEPSSPPEIEDDVLVRLSNGKTMLKRLLGLRGGIRLGSYSDSEIFHLREDEVTWMYYVAHPIPARRIKLRTEQHIYYEGPERRGRHEPVERERRRYGAT